MEVIEIPLSKLLSDKDNPRKNYEDIEELATSIQENGQEKPVDVENLGDGTYIIDDGHRRVNAFKIIKKRTGKEPMVKCIVKETLSSTERLMKRCAIENQNHSWSVEDRDSAWSKLWGELSKKKGFTKKDFGKKLGANDTAIENFFDRISLDKDIKGLGLGMNQIAETRGMEPDLRKKLLKRVAKEDIGRQQVRDIKTILNSTSSEHLKNAIVDGEIDIKHAEKIKDLDENRQATAIASIKHQKKEIEGVLKEIQKPTFKQKVKDEKKVISATQFVEKLRDLIFDTSNNMMLVEGVFTAIEEQELEQYFTPMMKDIIADSLEELESNILPGLKKVQSKIKQLRGK